MTDRPLVETARREALVCGLVFVCAITYTIWYCSTHGYTGSERVELRFVLGFPEWVFYGILCPWAVCTVICAWFSFFFMADHDLGEPAGEHRHEATDDVSENDVPENDVPNSDLAKGAGA